jgi:subtilisin
MSTDTSIPSQPEYTGRFLITDGAKDGAATIRALRDRAGLNVASSRDFAGQDVGPEAMRGADGIYLDAIGVTIVEPSGTDQLRGLSALEDEGRTIEPEQIVHAMSGDMGSYLEGMRDAIDAVAEKYGEEAAGGGSAGALDVDAEAIGATWGLRATNVVPGVLWGARGNGGAGIRVAVLDTGMDTGHPDFVGRTIVTQSFVPGEAVDDGHSHGTHCIGTACGPAVPATGVDRYGVAYNSEIYVGKVLSNAGSGADGWILGGINWAIANGCHVVSMSLGAGVSDGGFSAAYEHAAQAALNSGCLIVAAAGNGYSQPVSRPANSPSIMAVAAVDDMLAKAGFSNIGTFPPHGAIDIAGPGVGTFSSVPRHLGTHGNKSGTSMATPHVAGIAALYANTDPALRGMALWNKLTATAKVLPLPVEHVGAGLVQAPIYPRFRHWVDWPIFRHPILKDPVFIPKIPRFPPIPVPPFPEPPIPPLARGAKASKK